ncbi:DUF3973 domain-containing protein [Paenibacillus sp. P26]|nr:DUF3973 domain-containing protein [Paenibacillus sp. P26]UUZ90270.1 DUF3973 domain-containing protein [Paenibacillus sp. P25]
MYYCIRCGKLHAPKPIKRETIFKSGFHYYDSELYPAGICLAEDKSAALESKECKAASA